MIHKYIEILGGKTKQNRRSFCIAKEANHVSSAKYLSVSDINFAKTFNEITLNKLVNLTMLKQQSSIE